MTVTLRLKNAALSAAALTVCAVFVHASQAASQPMTWQTITSQRSVRDLLHHEGALWAATGGGIFRYDTAAHSFTLYANTDGLSGIHPSSLALDENGRLWIGMNDGTLNAIYLDSGRIRQVSIDPNPVVVNDLVYHDNSLYLALDFGVSLFLTGKEEVNSTFRVLGGFPVNTPVKRLFIFRNKLWAATSWGIAAANLDAPNLQDPQFWDNYTVAEGLPDNDVLCFAAAGDTLFVGTARGVARLDGGFMVSEGLANAGIRCLTFINGSLYAAGDAAVYRRLRQGLWQTAAPALESATALVQDAEGRIWAGHQRNGLYSYDPGVPEWINVVPTGPGGNTFEEMTIDAHNRLWVASGQSAGNGLYVYDGAAWKHFTKSDGLPSNNATGIAEGPDGRIWVGTPGQGVMLLEMTDDTLIVTKIDTAEGRLSGSDTPAFVVVQKIRRDRHGNVLLLNKFAANGRALVAVTQDDEWYYFSVTDGLVSTIVTQIAIDEFDRVWVGTAEDGLNVLDYGGTLGDKSDDRWSLYTTDSGLSSNRIGGLAAESGNGMWVATQNGIDHVIDGLPVENKYGALSNFTTAVTVDPAHNKWFGSPNGLSVLLADEFTWNYYTAENSDLVDNTIVSIYINERSGDAYIGTDAGLSLVHTPYKKPPDNPSLISAFPNPLILNGASGKLTIENILLESTVKIFTLSGRMVKELTAENGGVYGSLAFWNGTDAAGNPVASGIYLIVAGTDNAERGACKIAVIRR